MAARAVPRTAYGITKPVLETDQKMVSEVDAEIQIRLTQCASHNGENKLGYNTRKQLNTAVERRRILYGLEIEGQEVSGHKQNRHGESLCQRACPDRSFGDH